MRPRCGRVAIAASVVWRGVQKRPIPDPPPIIASHNSGFREFLLFLDGRCPRRRHWTARIESTILIFGFLLRRFQYLLEWEESKKRYISGLLIKQDESRQTRIIRNTKFITSIKIEFTQNNKNKKANVNKASDTL